MFKIDTYTCNKDTKILYFMNKNSKLGLAFDARRPIGSNIIHRCGIWGYCSDSAFPRESIVSLINYFWKIKNWAL